MHNLQKYMNMSRKLLIGLAPPQNITKYIQTKMYKNNETGIQYAHMSQHTMRRYDI